VTDGVDYAFSRPSPAGLFAAGKRFAMRYIGPGSDDKHLHASERDALWAAGLDVCLLAEGAANDALSGFSVGQTQASQALSDARALGAPDAIPIYFAVDFDVTSSQWPAVVQYFNGAASVIGRSRCGIYGGIHAMQWAARDGAAVWFFQTFAWSAGQWFPGNHVEQFQNDVTLAGGTVDLCRSSVSNFGQWGPGGPPQTRDDDMPAFVHCQQNGGFYAYGMGEPKWFLSTQAFNLARSAFGNPATVEVGTLDDVRNAFGYIPGTAAAVAAGTADVVADSHGNVLPPTGGGGGGTGPSAADIATAVNNEMSRRLAS
jgi:Domain of unknown function (DUF1906)